MVKYSSKFKTMVFWGCLIVITSTATSVYAQLVSHLTKVVSLKSGDLLYDQTKTGNLSKLESAQALYIKENIKSAYLKDQLLRNPDMWILAKITAGLNKDWENFIKKAGGYDSIMSYRACTEYSPIAYFFRTGELDSIQSVLEPSQPGKKLIINKENIESYSFKSKIGMAVGAVLRVFDHSPTVVSPKDINKIGGWVFRGYYEINDPDSPKINMVQFAKGNLLVEKGFSHCSLSSLYASWFRTHTDHSGGLSIGKLKVILAIKSKNGKRIELSRVGNFEVMFRPGTIFQVLDKPVFINNNKVLLVKLEEVGTISNIMKTGDNDNKNDDDDDKKDDPNNEAVIYDIFTGKKAPDDYLIKIENYLEIAKNFVPWDLGQWKSKKFPGHIKENLVIPDFSLPVQK